MANKVADPCRNCGAELAPGSSFCTLCGTAVLNRAAVSAPQAGSGPVPGIIDVRVGGTSPLVAPEQVGGNALFAAAVALSPGGAGRRLAAKIIDGVLPAVIMGAATALGTVQLMVAASGDNAQANPAMLLLLLGAGSLLTMAYGLWLWIWEARAGKTPGNLMLGLRTTNMDGGPAGFLAIFLRGLVIGVASVVPVVGPVLVIISNAWDANGKRQGWHDKAARTLVFNVKTGRNPMETGGVAGRADFTPAPVPTLSPVQSPLPAQPEAITVPEQATATTLSAQPAGPITSVPGFSRPATAAGGFGGGSAGAPAAAGAAQPTAQNAAAGGTAGTTQSTAANTPYSESLSFAPPAAPAPAPATPAPAPAAAAPAPAASPPAAPAAPAAAQADEDAGETRIRPAAAQSALILRFDDGTTASVDTVALIGRNPAGYDGEMISALIPIRDFGMSVSKTHLHVRAGNEGLWVIDRNSTNGSAISSANGVRTALSANTPALAVPGARVHFGDRSFSVGRA